MGIVAVWQGVVAALRALRRREVLRWLLLLEFSDLLLEGFHGYLALYLVDVAGSSASTAAMGVAVWSAAVLTGGLAMVPLLGRVRGQTYLWSSAAAVLATFPPMFLLVPVLGLKLVVIAMLGFASAGWYPVLQGRVYSSMPGQSGSVMAVKSASGLVGSFVPLALGSSSPALGPAGNDVAHACQPRSASGRYTHPTNSEAVPAGLLVAWSERKGAGARLAVP